MTDTISSPDHVLVCGERVERNIVDHECASYGDPLAVVRAIYWPAHDCPWSVFLFITRPSGVRVQYHGRGASVIEAAGTALLECTDDDVTAVLQSLRAMGQVAHA